MAGSGRISISSKLLCMLSLPVSMKRIPSRTTEKKWQHRFSNYNTICCHGNQWSDPDKFRTHPCFYACPHWLQALWKGSDDDNIFSIISLWDYFQTLKGSQLRSPWSDLAEFRTHSSPYIYHRYLQVWNESDQKRSRKRDDAVSHCNPICCHENQRSHLAEFRTLSSSYACPHNLQIWKGSKRK